MRNYDLQQSGDLRTTITTNLTNRQVKPMAMIMTESIIEVLVQCCVGLWLIANSIRTHR